MTTPVIPQGQEIQDLLHDVMLSDRLSSAWLTEVEQKIREIIAQQIEDALFGNPKTLLDLGVWAPSNGPNYPTVSDGLMGAANIVRGKTPITEEQWSSTVNAALRRRILKNDLHS